MEVGGYTLDMYCDNENHDGHKDRHREWPHQFCAETYSHARKQARAKGWVFHKDGTHSCPRCSGKKQEVKS